MEKHNDLSDRMLESAMRNVISYAPLALKHPYDYRYRAELMWTGTLAHNNLLDRGRIGDWGSHNIEHELSGLYDIAHGAGLAIVFPAWMKYVYREQVDRFVEWRHPRVSVSITLDDQDVVSSRRSTGWRPSSVSPDFPVRLSTRAVTRALKKWPRWRRGSLHLGNFKKLKADDVERILSSHSEPHFFASRYLSRDCDGLVCATTRALAHVGNTKARIVELTSWIRAS